MKAFSASSAVFVVALSLAQNLRGADEAPQPPASGAASEGAALTRLTGPTAESQKSVRAVVTLFEEKHLTQRLLDDDVSQRWLELYLAALDPHKQYFRQSDVDGFLQRSKELGQLAKEGDAAPAYTIFKVFFQRVVQCTGWAEEFAAGQHDFTVAEDIVSDPTAAHYSGVLNAAARETWRKRVKFDLLTLRLQGVADAPARQRLLSRYKFNLQRDRQLDDNQLLEIYLTALAHAFDPHSNYISPATLESFAVSTRQQLEGVGATIQTVDGEAIIIAVLPGGPVAKDGRLKKGDRIVGVGEGEAGPIVDVTMLSVNELVKLIRGKEGTIVRLQIIPEGQSDPRLFSLVRAKVQTAEARATIIEHGRKSDGTPFKIGIIYVPSLYSSAFQAGGVAAKAVTSDVRKLLEDPERGLKAAGVDAVLLDLRGNQGGTLTEAIALPGLFVGPGPLLQVKNRAGQTKTYLSGAKAAVWEGPLVVVVNRNTASGAEICAAAIQDYGRGLIVGDAHTFGLGTVQDVLDLGRQVVPQGDAPHLGALKFTTQQFFRVSGDTVQHDGVAADVALPSLFDPQKIGEAYLPYALGFERIERVNHPTFGVLTAAERAGLQALSDKRREASADFRRLADDIARLKARLDRKAAPLSETLARQDQPAVGQEPSSAAGPVFADNYYNNELLAITLDYLQMLKTRAAAAPPGP